MLRPFWIALQFLTRMPVPPLDEPSAPEVGRSLLAYPLVGLVLGLILWAADQFLTTEAPALRAALVLALWVLITGALHLDGLADSADAWLGGHGDRERTLAIMKDPYCGPAGVTVLVLVLIVKFAALTALLQADRGSGLLLAPVFARTALVALFLSVPYVRPGGLGSALAEHLPRQQAGWTVIVVALTGVLMAASAGVLALIILAVTFLALRGLMLRRIGGTTGDTAGGVVEIAEAVVLVAVAVS